MLDLHSVMERRAMSNGFILAIDQGTTRSTVLLFDHQASICGRASSEFTQYYPTPGWVEHDAEEIWLVTHRLIQSVLHEAAASAQDIRGIGIANQRETSLMWDRADSKPVGRAIVWQDRRTSTLCEKLKQEGLESAWQAKTGLLLDPYFSATKVSWMLQNIDGISDRAGNGDIAFGTIDTWLIWKLSGGAMHITDYSNASRTLLYNIHALEWDGEILSRLDKCNH